MGQCFKKDLEHINYEDQSFHIMFHGTTMTAAKKIKRHGFRRSSKGMLGPGVYVSRSMEKARRYPLNPEPGEKLVILRLRVRAGKVKRINRKGHPMQKTWHEHGYDTAWVPANCGMVPSGLEEDCVWDPKRIEVLDIWDNLRDYGVTYPNDTESLRSNDYAAYTDYAEDGEDYAEDGDDFAENGDDFAENGDDFAENGDDFAENGDNYTENGDNYPDEGDLYTDTTEYTNDSENYANNAIYVNCADNYADNADDGDIYVNCAVYTIDGDKYVNYTVYAD